jgi:hypothetical protein
MGATSSLLTGAAGEHYVLYQLHLRGLLAAQSPRGAYAAHVVVFSPAMGIGSMLQVKTRTLGAGLGWYMRQARETLLHPRLFYAFVDLQPEQPLVYVVPSAIVADVLLRTHRAWLATPGKGGRPHKDSKVRRILPWLPSPIPGYEGSWLEPYRERWDLLDEDRRLEQGIEE